MAPGNGHPGPSQESAVPKKPSSGGAAKGSKRNRTGAYDVEKWTSLTYTPGHGHPGNHTYTASDTEKATWEQLGYPKDLPKDLR